MPTSSAAACFVFPWPSSSSMAGGLAKYAKDKPDLPLSEIRGLVWGEVARGKASR